MHNKILFPHGTIQSHSHPSKNVQLNVGETVLVFPFRFFLAPIFYKNHIVTVSKVIKEINSAGIPMVELKGLGRARLSNRISMHFGNYSRVSYNNIPNSDALADSIRKKAQEFVFLIDIPESDRLIYLMTFITQLNELIDFISHYFITNSQKKWKLFTELDLQKKSTMLLSILNTLIHDVRIKQETGI